MTVLATAAGTAATGADFSNDVFWVWLLKAVGIIVFLLLSVLIAIWFERRVVGRMQLRPGPNVHGPFGLFQSLGDAMKLLLKEDITVKAADKVIYIVAPVIAVFCSLLTYAVIPFGPEVSIFGVVTPLQLTDFPVAVLYILACARWACTASCSAAGRPTRLPAAGCGAVHRPGDQLRTVDGPVPGQRVHRGRVDVDLADRGLPDPGVVADPAAARVHHLRDLDGR